MNGVNMEKNGKIRDKQMKRVFFILTIVFIIAVSMLSFFASSYLYDISYREGFRELKIKKNTKKTRTVKIGVISRYSPALILDGYQPLIDYLNRNNYYNFELVLSKNYLNTVKQLKNREIDFAFLGDMVFIENRKKLNLIPVACPINKEGKPFLRVVAIVRDDSNFNNYCQLKNQRVALPSKSSFSSHWALFMSKKCNIHIDIKRFNFHHTVVLQVLNGVCSAGVVREYVADEFKQNGIKIINYSPAIPSPPLVAVSTQDKKLIRFVQGKLLNFKGYRLKNSMIDKEFYYGFTIPSPSLYDNFEKYLRDSGILYE